MYSGRRSPEAKERRRKKALATHGLVLYNCQPKKAIKTGFTVAPEFSYSFRNEVVRAVSSCVLCGYNNVDALEIHHIDGNHENDSWNNIAIVCANCHQLITKGKLDYCQELYQKNLKISNGNQLIK